MEVGVLLILVAFLFGALRLPASALQLVGLIPATGPTWYEVLQGAIGVVQFLIALAMYTGYRKAGRVGRVLTSTSGTTVERVMGNDGPGLPQCRTAA